MTPEAAIAGLAAADRPFLIGVRHHSPACAAAIPALLEAFQPTRLLVELPAEFADWVAWLGHADCVAPIALAAAHGDGAGLGFWPFADFSPELVAVRWAVERGIPVEPFDLPIARRSEEVEPPDSGGREDDGGALLAALLRAADADDSESLWDRLVETPGTGADPEAIRRAALLYGWALRADAGKRARTSDLARERYMRERIHAGADERIAAVVGAFHGAGLADPSLDPLPRLGPAKPAGKPKKGKAPPSAVTSLLPYSFELLDSRSGYPAGIRDPRWQQQVFEAVTGGTPVDDVLVGAIVAICRDVRAARHVAGFPDAEEAVRVARDLATLRDLPGPGRRELLEAIETAIGRGEPLGRGRVLARALEGVLVGRTRGRLAAGTPRSGLGPHVEALWTALKLPIGGAKSRSDVALTLDPLRSDLDRRRHVALFRATAAGIVYADPDDGEASDDGALTHGWRVQWTPATDATIELAGIRGVTLQQAAAGTLRSTAAKLQADERLTAAIRLDILNSAAECGLADVAADGLVALMGPFVAEAKVGDLTRAIALVDRIARGHVPGLPPAGDESPAGVPGAVPAFAMPAEVRRAELLAAAVRGVDGLAGSDDLEDARALVELVRLFSANSEAEGDLGDGRLGWALDRLAADASALMQGAAGAARLLIGRESPVSFGERLGSWVDAAIDADAQKGLARRLAGALTVAGPAFEAHPDLLGGLLARVEALDDDGFLRRAPALRDGFDVLSPAARDRLLQAVAERLGDRGSAPAELAMDAAWLARIAAADAEGRRALERAGLLTDAPAIGGSAPSPIPTHAGNAIPSRDRWRLILGRQRDKLDPASGRYARALDELYGHGRGEGSRGDVGAGGGQEAPFPTVREWADELDALFGTGVRHEVVGRAAERGQAAAILALDPDQVVPSVDLLEQVLSLKGGLAEADLARLRAIVDRVVQALVQELANRVRPALIGLQVPRPTRRRTDRLDLRRTIDANLRTARPSAGGVELVPERLIYRTRGRKSVDWRVFLVVDTSGSMEPSVLYSAMMAAILSGLPAVDVRFVAFSTEVVDLSGRVDDPLGLLLEVKVGGGTHIGKALRYVREQITVPSRSIVVLVTDFEEGVSVPGMLAEIRALVESGCKALGLAALDDHAQPRFSTAIAEQVVAAGMPVAALTPVELARWVGERIR
jgi:hypothetical protein